MVHVTERAREVFKETLGHVTDGPEIALRVGATASGLGVFPDTRRDDDEVVEHEGQAVLLIDREVSEVLADKTIDVEERPDGSRFVLLK